MTEAREDMRKQTDFRRNHMLTRWIITGCIVVMIPVLCSFLIFMLNEKVLERKMEQVNKFIVRDIQRNIDDRVKDIINVAQSIYLDIDFSEGRLNTEDERLFRSRIAACFNKLSTYQIANSEVDVFIYLPEKDFILATTVADDMRYIYGTLNREKKINCSQEEWREQIVSATANKVLMTTNLSYRNYGKRSLTYVMQSSIGHKEQASVICVSAVTDFITAVTEKEKSYPCTVLIVDREGNLLADYGEPLPDPEGLRWEKQAENETLFSFDNGGTVYVASYVRSEICEWGYIVCTPKADYRNELRGNMVVNIVILFLGMTLGIVSMTFLQRHNYEPVRTMHRENLSMKNRLNSQKEQEKEWKVLKALRYEKGAHRESLEILAGWKADTAVWLPVTIAVWQEGEETEEEETSLLTFSVRNVAEELLGEQCRYLKTSDNGFLVYLFVMEQTAASEGIEHCRKSLSELCAFFRENFHIELSVMMGEPLEEKELPEGYARLMEGNRLRNLEPVFGVREITEFYREQGEEFAAEAESSREGTGGLSEEIKAYVRENYADCNLNIASIARHFSLSDRYLSKLFKDKTGVSLPDYINQVRVEQAEILLKTTFKTVDEIVEEVGYTNSRSFRRNFQKITGKNAASYKKRS